MTSDLGGLSAPGHFVLNLVMAAGPGHLGRMTMSPQRTPFLLPHATQLNWSVLAAGSLSLEQGIAHWTDTDGDTVTTLRVARDDCYLLQFCQQDSGYQAGPRPLIEMPHTWQKDPSDASRDAFPRGN